MSMASLNWHNKDIIRELEQVYQMNEEIEGLRFHLIRSNEQLCSYDMNQFIMFWSDIIDQLRMSPPFTNFQVNVLNLINVYLS